MLPIQLAEQIMKMVGDHDSETAQTALQIVRLLISHRDCCAIAFELNCFNDSQHES